MAVRSASLWHLNVGAGVQNVYTVPAGKRTILKSVTLAKTAAAAITIAIEVVIAGPIVVPVLELALAVGAQSTLWEPYLILEAGDVVRFNNSAAGVGSFGSGPELIL